MSKSITITEAREKLSSLPEKLSRRKRALAVTRGGKKVLAVMTWEQYASLVDTRDIQRDPEMMKAIRDGERSIAAGRGIPLEELRHRLGL
jgi:PHD/YefM family antitoxin component YafN of YafNO toxin-antitoxin module